MLVQLNKCVIACGSDPQRGHSGDRDCLLFKYECSMGHLFVLSRLGYDGLLWKVLFRSDAP